MSYLSFLQSKNHRLNCGKNPFLSFTYQLCGLRVRAKTCGHLTKLKGIIEFFDEIRKCKICFKYEEVEYCLDCLAEKTIRCARCGRPIFVGDPVTKYPADPLLPIPSYAHQILYFEKMSLLIGCFRPECISNFWSEYDNSFRPDGFWWPSGFHLAKPDMILWKVIKESKIVLPD